MEEPVAVALSKRKTVLVVVGSLAFVAGAIWIWSMAGTQHRVDPVFVRVIAVVALVFFGACGVYGSVKLLDAKPGLIVDAEGLVDNSSATAVGRVRWDEIAEIRVTELRGQRFLTVLVTDPQRFALRGGWFTRMVHAANLKLTGSPVNLASNTLTISFRQLEQLVTGGLARHRAKV